MASNDQDANSELSNPPHTPQPTPGTDLRAAIDGAIQEHDAKNLVYPVRDDDAIDRILTELATRIEQMKKDGAAKEGTMIKTCEHKYVDPDNLYKCQVYGYNTALDQVKTMLNKRKGE